MKKNIPYNIGIWCFRKCNAEVIEYEYIYLLNIGIQHHTSELASNVSFEEVTSKILGINVKDFYLLH